MTMDCCAGCFSDDYLVAQINSLGAINPDACEWCGSAGRYSVTYDVIGRLFCEVASLFFIKYPDLMASRAVDATDGERLGDLFDQEFGVFSEALSEDRNELAWELANHDVSIRDIQQGGQYFCEADDFWFRRDADSDAPDPTDHLLAPLACLESAVALYGHSLDVRSGGVGAAVDVANAAQTLVDEFSGHVQDLSAGHVLYRARVESNDPLSSPNDLLPPPAALATAGRVNIAGERVLYVAESEATAVAEVRPAIGDIVAVGRIALTRPARVCLLMREPIQFSVFSDPQAFHDAANQGRCRELLGTSFARPIRPSDTGRDYLFTQFIARLVKHIGIDGIVYRSSQRAHDWRDYGVNYVFFDPFIGVPQDIHRRNVSAVDYTHFPIP